MSWPCTSCGAECTVIDTRQFDEGRRRRRQCSACGERFTTVEVPLGEGKRAVDFLGMGRQMQSRMRNEVLAEMVEFLKSKEVIEVDESTG